MSASLEQIHAVLNPYLSDTYGNVGLPANLLDLLEDADDAAKYKAELMEGYLALYAGNRIPADVLRERLQDLVVLRMHVATGPTIQYSNAVPAYSSISADSPSITLAPTMERPPETSRVEIGRALEHETAR